jgi:hypothetical protein
LSSEVIRLSPRAVRERRLRILLEYGRQLIQRFGALPIGCNKQGFILRVTEEAQRRFQVSTQTAQDYATTVQLILSAEDKGVLT